MYLQMVTYDYPIAVYNIILLLFTHRGTYVYYTLNVY